MRHAFRYRAALLAGATAILLASCGGGSSGGTTPTVLSLADQSDSTSASETTTTAQVDPDEAFRQYTACMREQGIDMPDPTSDGGSFTVQGGEGDFEAYEEADKECAPILESAFGEFDLSPEQQAEFMDQELAFAQCMRDNGVDWPDPDPSGGLGTISLDIGDIDEETLNTAMEVCSEEAFGELGGLVSVGTETSP